MGVTNIPGRWPLLMALAMFGATVVQGSIFTELPPSGKPGPCKWTVIRYPDFTVPSPSPCTARDCKLPLTLRVPAAGCFYDRYPIIIQFNGFQTISKWYTAYTEFLASWGYVAISYDVGIGQIVVDREELSYLPFIAEFVAASALLPNSPLYGKWDGQAGAIGHSRGGKLSALLLGNNNGTGTAFMSALARLPPQGGLLGADPEPLVPVNTKLGTAVLIDPVDNTAFSPPSDDYPSGVQAVEGQTAAVVGAGVSGACNPRNANYQKFYAVLSVGSWEMVIKDAGHVSFIDGAHVVNKVGNLFCGKGKITNNEAVSYTRALMVAWLENNFRRMDAGTAVIVEKFARWAADKENDLIHSIEFDIKLA